MSAVLEKVTNYLGLHTHVISLVDRHESNGVERVGSTQSLDHFRSFVDWIDNVAAMADYQNPILFFLFFFILACFAAISSWVATACPVCFRCSISLFRLSNTIKYEANHEYVITIRDKRKQKNKRRMIKNQQMVPLIRRFLNRHFKGIIWIQTDTCGTFTTCK